MRWAAHLNRTFFGRFLLLFRSRSRIYSGRMCSGCCLSLRRPTSCLLEPILTQSVLWVASGV